MYMILAEIDPTCIDNSVICDSRRGNPFVATIIHFFFASPTQDFFMAYLRWIVAAATLSSASIANQLRPKWRNAPLAAELVQSNVTTTQKTITLPRAPTSATSPNA